MPSASTTADSKAANNDPTESIKQAVQLVEKKIRNLEKRKQKLDDTREKLKSGDVELNPDQREAINRINVVEGNLELIRELKGQLGQLQTDTEKAWVKQQKRERRERQLAEMERFQSLLIVMNVLENMGEDETRTDFKEGNNGAVKLSEEDLTKLDELHQLINPERNEDSEFQDKLKSSSDHIVSLLDGREKEVIGTTYQKLKALTDSIYNCPYWKKSGEPEVVTAVVPSPAENGELVPEVATPDNEYVDAEDGLTPPEPAAAEVLTASDVTPSHPIAEQQQQQQQQQQVPVMSNTSTVVNESAYFVAPKQRAFNEIVSSVQGNFNFLQDSEIESISLAQQEAAHIDPAILHAQPRKLPTQETTMANTGPAPYQQFSQDTESQAPTQTQTFYNSMVHEARPGQNLPGFNDTPDKPEPIPLPSQNKLMTDSFASAASHGQTAADTGSFQTFSPDGADDNGVGEKDDDLDQDGFQSWGHRNNRGPRGGNRSNQRGGGQNGYRGNQRGGNFAGNNGQARGGGRGGRGSWSGYPPRDNYRPEGGYQGYQAQGQGQNQGQGQREQREGAGNQGGYNNRRGGNRGVDGHRERGGRGGGFGGRGGGFGQRGGGAPRGGRNNYQQHQTQQENVQQSA